MANRIRTRRRAVGGAAGPPASLLSGELACNEQTNVLYYGKGDDGSGNATSIIEVGGSGATNTWGISITGSSASCTGNAATASAWATGRTITLTGDVTGVSAAWTGSGNISFATTIAAGAIVDADVNASAAIAGTKISPDFGSQDVTTTGIVGFGGAVLAGDQVRITDNQTSAISTSCKAVITASSGVTNSIGFATFGTTAVGSAVTNFRHFRAVQQTFNVAPTNQYGFEVNNTLTGATNNYGFYSAIASGAARWNFYAAGTADNFLAGNLLIGSTGTPTSLLHVAPANANSLLIAGQLQNRNAGASTGVGLAFITSATDLADNRYAYIAGVTTGAAQNGTNIVLAPNANGAPAAVVATILSTGVNLTGNTKIGGTADRSTTAGTNQLVVFNGTAPVGTLTNGGSFYASSGELLGMNASGTPSNLTAPFTSTVRGVVPASGGGTSNFLRADGTWAAPAGGGNVTGPGSSTDNALVRFDGTAGTAIQNSGATLSDTGVLTLASGGGLVLPNGGATQAPLKIGVGGALLTTPEVGAFEADANCFYGCTDAGNRGVLPIVHILRQESTYTLSNVGTAQQLFNAATNGRLTLEVGVYEFEILVALTSMSGTSGNATFSLAGTATLGSIIWHGFGRDAAADATTGTLSGSYSVDSTLVTAPLITAGTATAMMAKLEGTFEVTGAGTWQPQITLQTAAAAIVSAGSYAKVWRMGSTTLAAVGQWD